MHLADLTPHLIYKFKSESELVDTILKISERFNFDRDKIDEYVLSEKQVAAYTCFYGATNIAKLQACLDKIGIKDLSHYELIDIGCGPATFSLAALSLNAEQKIIGLESSKLMRDQAAKLLKGLFPSANANLYESVEKVPRKTDLKRIGLFGHSANEMEEDLIKKIIIKLELDDVLFIEPGTKYFFEKMKTIRTWLVNSDYSINYPCAGGSTCPVPEGDWCHQYIKVSHEHDVERLCQLVKKDRRLMPIILHHYSKGNLEPRTGELVQRVYPPLKFASSMDICQLDQDELKIIPLEVVYKGLGKSQIKALQKILAGDKIEFEVSKELNNGVRRVTWTN